MGHLGKGQLPRAKPVSHEQGYCNRDYPQRCNLLPVHEAKIVQSMLFATGILGSPDLQQVFRLFSPLELPILSRSLTLEIP